MVCTAVYTAKNYDRALLAPEEAFESPMDVVETESMTPEQKMKVLQHWEVNERDLQAATEEGMASPGRSLLGEVRRAINKLCEKADIDKRGTAI